MGVLAWGQKVFTSVINIRVDHWIGYQNIKDSLGQIKNTIQPSFTIEHAEQKEEFDAAVERLHLEPADLVARVNEFTRLFSIYLLCALMVFFYSIYLFYNNNWGGGLMALAITLYPVHLTFRFHFWLYQLRNKKLGCSLKDWWNN